LVLPILSGVEYGFSNGRVKGLNTKARVIVRRASGFHFADVALALVMLGAGSIDLKLPHE
jgi:transposase